MVEFHARRLYSALIMLVLLMTLSTHIRIAHCDNSAYDEKEAIRRSAERLMEYDRAQKEAAKKRYDSTHSSNSDASGPSGVVCCVGGILLLAVAWGLSGVNEEKEKEKKAAGAKEAEVRQQQKTLLASKIEKATLLGFSMENETKECPSCAEAIKLKANVCKFCKREFSEDEKDEAIKSKVDQFLSGVVNRGIGDVDTLT